MSAATMLTPDIPLDVLLPAVLAGSLVIATHVPLGIQVLRRGIIFIDLAIAQVAGLGAYLVTMLLGEAASQVWIQAGAVALALAAAWLLVATERLTVRYQEPVIGIVFVLAATAVILLLAKDPHGGEHLADLLAGQILWISKTQLLYSALATVALLAAMFALRGRARAFYGLFAVAITVSVQMAGVYLVFATLIIPALATARLGAGVRRVIAGYATAIAGYGMGLVGSAVFDLPTGPLIVWGLAIGGIVALVLCRRVKPGND